MQPNKKIDEATRAIQDELFDWWGTDTSTRNGRSNADITVNRISPARKGKKEDIDKYRYSITFRNKVNENFGKYIDITVFKNRILMRPGIEGKSRKFYGSEKTNRNIVIVETEKTKVLKDFIGDYRLRYDETYEFWYVEK